MKRLMTLTGLAFFASTTLADDTPLQYKNGPVSLHALPDRVVQASAGFSDPYYSEQTYLFAEKLTPNGLGISAAQPLVKPYRPLRIGVIDGGFFNTVTDIPFVGGYDAIDDDDDPFVAPESCDFGHGTAVSAVIAASRNNGIGIAGVMDADIVPVRGLDCDTGYQSSIIRGMEYLLSLEGTPLEVDVINLSLGGEGACSESMQSLIDRANAFNIPVVVAAGNESVDVSAVSPANCDGVISVAALAYDPQQQYSRDLASFSNYGKGITLSVQGERIIAPNRNDDDIVAVDGTSFSAPLVAGVVGMMKSQWPDASTDDLIHVLSSTARKTADDSLCAAQGCGAGGMDALDATRYSHALSGNQRHGALRSVLADNSCRSAPQATYDTLMSAQYCDTWELSFNNLDAYQPDDNVVMKIHAMSNVEGEYAMLSPQSQPLMTFEGTRGVVTVDSSEGEIGLQRCVDGECAPYLLKIQRQLGTLPTYCF